MTTRKRKLGPHHLQGGSLTREWMPLCTVAKCVDDFGPSFEQQPVGTLLVGRRVDDGHMPGGGFDFNRYAWQYTPAEACAFYVAWLEHYIPLNPHITHWSGPNEQTFERDDAQEAADPAVASDFQARRVHTMKWYAEFLYLFAAAMRERGKVAVIGGWAVTNPEPRWGLWEHYTRALDAVRDHGAILDRHEYGPLDGVYSLRYRVDQAEFTGLGYPDMPVIISECGADYVGGQTAFRGAYWNGDMDRYWDELLGPYAWEIEKDSYCLGATVFSVGLWHEFNVDGTDIVERVRGYDFPPETPPADEPQPPQPLFWAVILDRGLALRDADGNPAHHPVYAPTGSPVGVVHPGTRIPVYAEDVTAGAFSQRANITPDGLNVWMDGVPATTYVRES